MSNALDLTDFPPLPTVPILISDGLGGTRTVRAPRLCYRGVWSAIGFPDDGGGAIDGLYLLAHRAGFVLGTFARGATVLRDSDTAVNAIRALQPWADFAADAPFGASPQPPAEALQAVREALHASQPKVVFAYDARTGEALS